MDSYDYYDHDIKALKEALKEYYGTAACSGLPAAFMDLIETEDMSEAEVIRRAREAGII